MNIAEITIMLTLCCVILFGSWLNWGGCLMERWNRRKEKRRLRAARAADKVRRLGLRR